MFSAPQSMKLTDWGCPDCGPYERQPHTVMVWLTQITGHIVYLDLHPDFEWEASCFSDEQDFTVTARDPYTAMYNISKALMNARMVKHD